ncbi:MAG: S41 family peptidase [Caulobacteraceae bacterium]
MTFRIMVCGLLAFAFCVAPAAAEDETNDLTAYLRHAYPSLAYVDRYRQDFPAEVEGSDAAWSIHKTLPPIATAREAVAALIGLGDQHVALTGPKAGKTETLGVLFRTSADGHMIAWRVFGPGVAGIRRGDEVVQVDTVPVAEWLRKAASVTFGGNPRSRQAEAALDLGMGAPVVHRTAGVGQTVSLTVRAANGAARVVRLAYRPMDDGLATSMTAAINAPDLPEVMKFGRYRVGAIRIGAFAPQYDPVFTAAADAAPETPADPDRPMLAGFCAVTRRLIAKFDAIAGGSDLMVVDLRGNLGGFGREARLFAWALTGKAPPRTYDVFSTGKAGAIRLETEPEDGSCGQVRSAKPVIVLTDAGLRSAGELMAAWMWASGALVIGERSVGAGGGRDYASKGFPLGSSGYNLLISGNFTIFDPTGEWRPGEMAEARFVDRVAAERFAPSRDRPFGIQAVGLKPDIETPTRLGDLRDAGRSALGRGIAIAMKKGVPR